jgi:hypothetical protein
MYVSLSACLVYTYRTCLSAVWLELIGYLQWPETMGHSGYPNLDNSKCEGSNVNPDFKNLADTWAKNLSATNMYPQLKSPVVYCITKVWRSNTMVQGILSPVILRNTPAIWDEPPSVQLGMGQKLPIFGGFEVLTHTDPCNASSSAFLRPQKTCFCRRSSHIGTQVWWWNNYSISSYFAKHAFFIIFSGVTPTYGSWGEPLVSWSVSQWPSSMYLP